MKSQVQESHYLVTIATNSEVDIDCAILTTVSLVPRSPGNRSSCSFKKLGAVGFTSFMCRLRPAKSKSIVFDGYLLLSCFLTCMAKIATY